MCGAPGRPIVPSRGLRVLLCRMLIPIAATASAAALGAWAYGTYEPNGSLFGRAVGRGPTRERVAYLTFDDGPNPGATEPILETLAASAVPAAFFLVGAHVRRFPKVPRRVAEEIRARVRRKLRPGAILLVHDGDGYDPGGDRRRTAAALPGIIADARSAGYTLRPLGELVL